MEVGIKEVAYNALSLLMVSGIITEEEFKKHTNDKNNGYDELFDLLEEKHKQFYPKADNNSQK